MSCWLLLGASYPFSKIVGVFSVVDEDSCSCLLLSRPCPIEIAEKSALKNRGFPCPILTRYCCRRETLLDLSSGVTHRPGPVTVTNQQWRHTTEFYTTTHPPVTGANFSLTASERPVVKSIEGGNPHVSSYSSGTADSDENSSEVPLSAIPSVAQETETESSRLFRDVRNEKVSSRRPKMVACSCMTQDDCISSWSFFADHLPQVDIRTSMSCDGGDEITCCLGRILPPRSQKSRGRNPGMTTTTSPWLPLKAAWEDLVSWLNG
ncbi:uncharacterized protein [Panulirus ornatus]|uniref:uncharacterized protein isoform X2 n=1 Tax=Panulirus ornatus TaxID=150431 RepID=UPI003A8B68E3